MRHLALFAPLWPPDSSANGIVTYVSEVKKLAESSGHRVTIVTHRSIHHSNGSVTSIGKPSSHRRAVLRLMGKSIHQTIGVEIAQQIRRHCSDIDIVEMEESFGWVKDVQDRLKVPVVIRLHGPHVFGQVDAPAPETKGASDQRILDEGCAIREAKYISAPSKQILADTISVYGASPTLSKSYPNPLDPGHKPMWCYDECNKYQILHVGRFDRRKGADVIIQAFCEIASEFPFAELIMVGPETGVQDGTGEYLDFSRYLDKYVPFDLRMKIKFLGKLPPDEIEKLRDKCHICVIPSRFEVLPYSALESLAKGLPLIVSDGFADNALVIERETGWMAENGCPQSFARKLRDAFNMGDDIEIIGLNGRAFFMENFSTLSVRDSALNFYEDVIADFNRQ